jgi:hypothetical protein
MPALIMRLIIHQIAIFLYHVSRRRHQLVRKPAHARRLRDVLGGRAERAVRVDGCRERGGEVVQRDVCENVGQCGRFVAPFEKFLADPESVSLAISWYMGWNGLPGEKSERVRREDVADCRGARAVLDVVSDARLAPLDAAGYGGFFGCGEFGFVGCVFGG